MVNGIVSKVLTDDLVVPKLREAWNKVISFEKDDIEENKTITLNFNDKKIELFNKKVEKFDNRFVLYTDKGVFFIHYLL